jgi:CRP-like cAMP-binding protein/Fe-S-cluster-containing hydrogenase component 2
MDILKKEHILKIPLFSGIDPEKIFPLLHDCTLKQYRKGQTIYRYGEFGEDCCIILSGTVIVELPRKGKENKNITLQDGEIFGEIAALSRYARTADVISAQKTTILILSRQKLLELFDTFPLFKERIDTLYRHRVLSAQFLTVPMFTRVPAPVLDELIQKATLHHYREGEVIFQQGDEGDAFYFIRYGFVKLSERKTDGKEVVLAYLKGGHHFGEMSLFQEGGKRMATATAIHRTEVIRITRSDFLDIVETYPRLKDSLEIAIDNLKKKNVYTSQDEHSENILNTLIDSGFIRAKEILIIDNTKCIQCNTCIKACAVLHNNQSRLVRKGKKLANILLVATSCFHCDDPSCMIGCPTGSIARNSRGEIFVKDSCIGCGKCARNCPYGNILTVDGSEPGKISVFPPGFIKGNFRFMRNRADDSETRIPHKDNKKMKQRKKVIKCDMCADYPFLGCVYNCPTGAARMVNPEFFTEVTTLG